MARSKKNQNWSSRHKKALIGAGIGLPLGAAGAYAGYRGYKRYKNRHKKNFVNPASFYKIYYEKDFPQDWKKNEDGKWIRKSQTRPPPLTIPSRPWVKRPLEPLPPPNYFGKHRRHRSRSRRSYRRHRRSRHSRRRYRRSRRSNRRRHRHSRH